MSKELSKPSPALPELIDRAANALQNARTSAEVLEARDLARAVYDAAKSAARIAKAKQAHDDLIAAAHRAQADALEIEAGAKRRLADEYDAAQERGEIGKRGDFGGVTSRGEDTPTVADIGVTHKDIHEARTIRDAEKNSPGIVRETLDQALAAGEEPTKAKVRRAVSEAANRAPKKRAKQPDDADWARQRAANADALPQHVKDREVAKSQAKARKADGLSDAERIAELEESVRALEAEAAALRSENKKFEEMRVQFEAGGFEAVIAGKDEQIRVLKGQVESESKEKMRNLRRSDKYYKILKEQYHHFDDVVLKVGEPANG